MVLKESQNKQKKITTSDIVRQAINSYILYEEDNWNSYYEVLNEKNEFSKIKLSLGDEDIEAEIGCFEMLFLSNNFFEAKRIECNFTLRSNKLFKYEHIHPSFFSLELQEDLLHKKPSYKYNYYLTNNNSLDLFSRYSKHYQNTIQDNESQGHKLYYENVYKTIDLPKIKLMCRKFKHFPIGTFNEYGWIFNFTKNLKV
jgi:hypothetical protein